SGPGGHATQQATAHRPAGEPEAARPSRLVLLPPLAGGGRDGAVSGRIAIHRALRARPIPAFPRKRGKERSRSESAARLVSPAVHPHLDTIAGLAGHSSEAIPMRMDKLTSRFQQALADAQSLAVGRDHNMIEPAHLLVALLDQQGGGTRPLLSQAAVNVPLLRER